MAVTSLSRTYDAEITLAIEDLVRESLCSLLPVTVGLAWLWLAQVILAGRSYLVWAYAVLAIVTAAAAVSYGQHERRLALAVGVYLAGLAIVVTMIACVVQGMAVSYLYLLVVLVAAVLTSQRTMWAVTLGSIGLAVAVGRGAHLMPFGDLASVILFILLAALTAWLSSRRLVTALAWALNMAREARKNAEDARARRAEVRSMLKSLDEAYARLERANEALIYAREAAEKAYRFKAEFVANVSHELRTPLNLIVGFSEMMATAPESYQGKRLPSQYRGDVVAIYRSAKHLSDLIDDVLDLAQIEAGHLPLTRQITDLKEIIHEAAEIIRGLVEAKGLRIELDLPPTLPMLRLDPTRIRQVLLNLLSNATRFTEQGWIRVSARVQEREVEIRVEDSGRGIAPDKLAQAFQAFSQLDDDRARQGTGLGLAVSRKFVELHGGRMWIDSVLGRGTIVGFSLPIGDGRLVAPALIKTRAPAGSGDEQPRVLVVHEDPHILTVLRRYVDGVQFVLATTIERAIEALKDEPPLAVIADSALADQGLRSEAWVQLMADRPLLTCPLPGLQRLGLLLGAVDSLTKPVRREELLAALDRLPRQPRSVLIVDDDPSFARLMIRMLHAQDPEMRLLVSTGGAQGLAMARSERPDLVLLDLLMPEVNGYDFMDAVRQDPALAEMSVIILSAHRPELEARPLAGELRLTRPDGLTPAQTLQAIQALVGLLTLPAAMDQAIVVAP